MFRVASARGAGGSHGQPGEPPAGEALRPPRRAPEEGARGLQLRRRAAHGGGRGASGASGASGGEGGGRGGGEKGVVWVDRKGTVRRLFLQEGRGWGLLLVFWQSLLFGKLKREATLFWFPSGGGPYNDTFKSV